MTQEAPVDTDLLAAYAEIAGRRARRITELTLELEALRARKDDGRRPLERRIEELTRENQQLRRDLRSARRTLSRIRALPPVRVAVRVRRAARRLGAR